MGVFVGNTANSINNSRDKLRALQILSRHDIGLASTSSSRTQADHPPRHPTRRGAPIIIKLMQGTQGMGVILAESEKVAEAIVEAMHGARQNVLIQKFVAESKGRDIRAFVVGDRVVAAMRRTARGQEFRSNIHRGATAEAVTLEPAYERAAVRAAASSASASPAWTCSNPHAQSSKSTHPRTRSIECTTEIDVAEPSLTISATKSPSPNSTSAMPTISAYSGEPGVRLKSPMSTNSSGCGGSGNPNSETPVTAPPSFA